jgi:hypothetical protein
MKLPGINDLAAQADKVAKNVAKGLEKSLEQNAAQLEQVPGKIDKAIVKSLEGLYQGIDLAADASSRDIRAKGDLLATGFQVLGDAGTKVGDAQLDVLAKFSDVYGKILDSRLEQSGRLAEILIGKNPLLQKLDIFDLLAARKCGTIEQAPANNLKGLLDRIRELLENGVFAPQPKPTQPPTGTAGDVPAGALQGMVEQIRDLIATLVDAIKQRGNQPPGSTNPLPPITNPAPVPGTNGSSDFKDAIFGQVRTIDAKIADLRAEIASGKLTPEQAQEKMIELQEQMQLKMQLIQMLTSLMKSEHDIAMAVIRNLAL